MHQPLIRDEEVEEPTRLEIYQHINHLLHDLMGPLNEYIFQVQGNKVLSGPFEGMEIPCQTSWDDSNASVKLFGLYEFEIFGAIDLAIKRDPRTIVNVGCSEGYYAIGLARCHPDISVIAMDIDEGSLSLCRRYADINGVNNITTINGATTPEELDVGGPGHRLYLVDVEMAELNILKPDVCKPLLHSDVIVECHDFMHNGITDEIALRFQDTHYIAKIEPQIPIFDAFKFTGGVSALNFLSLLEKRPLPTNWLACYAKDHSDESRREEYRVKMEALRQETLKKEEDEKRRKALDDLVADAQDLGMGY